MNKESSTLDLKKSNLINVLLSFSNQELGTCVNPIKDFCSFHAYIGCSLSTNLGTWHIYTYLMIIPLRNALLASIFLRGHLNATKTMGMILIVPNFTTVLDILT